MSFTELSVKSATEHAGQFGNVYEKGALISAGLDLYLLHYSNGGYDLQKLKHDLSILYGKDKFFEDAALFDFITAMTYPQIKKYFEHYVEGTKPLPFAEIFALAGVKYLPEKKTEEFSLGGFVPAVTEDSKIYIANASRLNDFGKKMGYLKGDIIISINGVAVNAANGTEVFGKIRNNLKEGQDVIMMVSRKKADSSYETIKLSAPATKIPVVKKHVLEFIPDPDAQQVMVRNAWLTTTDRPVSPPAASQDVSDINGIISTLYDVISGAPGKRNWERFRSIYYPGTKMASTRVLANGQTTFSSFSTEDYIKSNGSFFEANGFWENELGREVNQYGSIATVRSAYQFKTKQDGPIEQRGINFITLVKDKGRWWITSSTWQSETPDNPIPSALLKN